MNSRDAILKALTPNDMFNQKGLVWRSISTLAQFAFVEQGEVLGILDEHFQGLVSVRPNGKCPENGPLVALNEHIANEPADVFPGRAPQVAIMGGNAVAAAIQGVAALDKAAPQAEPMVEVSVLDEDSSAEVLGDHVVEFVGEVEEQDHE